MKLSNKAYDILKFFCTIFCPALGTFIFALSKIWGFPPYAENIVGTISALAIFIGALIGISSRQYYNDAANDLDPPTDGE